MVSWESGEQIVLYACIGSTWSLVLPATVVSDESGWLMLYVAAETPCKRLHVPSGSVLPRVLSSEQIAKLPQRHVDSTWSRTHLLHLTPTNRGYSIYLKWSVPDWEFLGWYVNLQMPLRRLLGIPGIETEDLYLDIVVDPDRSWRWKDEDELAEAVLVGRVTADQARDIRAEGERVAAVIDGGEWPFTSEVAMWRPEPDWPIPELPAGWDQS